jgi:hypothetical protein
VGNGSAISTEAMIITLALLDRRTAGAYAFFEWPGIWSV